MTREIKWAYGITTVVGREKLLLQTIDSLDRAGFDRPRLFIDTRLEESSKVDTRFLIYPCSVRYPNIGCYANWWLAAQELHMRHPTADRYAIFQDDIIVSAGTKKYIEGVDLGVGLTFLNLFTFSENEKYVKNVPRGSWVPSDQRVRGAVALVFNRITLQRILRDSFMISKPGLSQYPTKKLDTALANAVKTHSLTELIHNPSLVQHMGQESTIGNTEYWKAVPSQALSFDIEYDPTKKEGANNNG